MGNIAACNYSQLYMDKKIDSKILEEAAKFGDGTYPIRIFKRYIDDCFILWIGSRENLELFLAHINTLFPSIKFTSSFSCPSVCEVSEPGHVCSHTDFLDTTVYMKNGKFETDLYRKPTDRCMYLLPSSCHPPSTTKSIPYSLAYRLIRICSEPDVLTKRLAELKDLLLSRDYRPNWGQGCTAIPRETVLGKTLVFLQVMKEDPTLAKIFPERPLVAYRRPQSLRDK